MKNCFAPMFALLAVCCAAAVITAAQVAQGPIAQAEQLSGAWEVVRAPGIDGIFLSISTHVRGTTAQSETASQDVHIRLYHREAGRDTWGWYVAAAPGARDEPAVLDGERLRLRAVSDGPVIDVVFDPAKQGWTGTWTRGGKSQDVILERPRAAPRALPNDLVGDWESLPDSTYPWRAQTSLHIYESADGALTAWMDRFIALIDQRHGELLQVLPGENRAVGLETTSAVGMRYRFLGTVSADGSTLVGNWQRGDGSGGGTLNAAASLRRIR